MMSDKTSSSSARVSLVLSCVIALLCVGEFLRVELILREHRAEIDRKQDKTDCKPCEKTTTKRKEIHSSGASNIINVPQGTLGTHRAHRARRSPVSSPTNNTSLHQVLKMLVRQPMHGIEFNKSLARVCGVKNNVCPPGPPGPSGPPGPPSPPGPAGPPGPSGFPGKPGHNGHNGSPGGRGRRGPRGRPGLNGNMGETGLSGEQGIMGPRGLKGDKGETGTRGPQGLPGYDGSPGRSILAPEITVSPLSLTVNESETAWLYCTSRGNPWPKVEWKRIGGLLDKTAKVHRDNEGSNTLQIKNVSCDASGLYECKGSSIIGNTQQTTRLIVNCRPRVLTSVVGGTLSLDCQATANPTAVVSWSKENKPIVSDRSQVHDNGTLTIRGLKNSDSGMYFCKADSAGVFFARAVVKLQVVPGPFDIKFDGTSTTDYVIVTGQWQRPQSFMSAVSLCFWMKTADTKREATVVSYAVPGENNEIWFYGPTGFSLQIASSSSWKTNVAANDGRWHHICLTWENTAGQTFIYKDGTVGAQRTNLQKGHVIRKGGALVIGQEQDSFGGSFQLLQSFAGELTGINMWSRALGPSEISVLSRACSGAGQGDVLSWGDSILSGRRGQAQVITPSSCEKK